MFEQEIAYIYGIVCSKKTRLNSYYLQSMHNKKIHCNIKQLDYINYKGPYKNTSQLVFGSDSILSVEFYLSPRLVDL